MFKEWKSYANLHAFDTQNASIAEGLVWASICAALLKMFLAHAAQRLIQVAISTRTAAMCLRSSLTRVLMHWRTIGVDCEAVYTMSWLSWPRTPDVHTQNATG